MTHLSQKHLDKNTDKLLDRLLRSLFGGIKEKDVESITGLVLSDTELAMIKKRLGIILFLEQNLTHDEVSKITKTTRQTVGRIALEWKLLPLPKRKTILSYLRGAYTKQQIKDLITSILGTDISIRNQLRKLTSI